MLIPGFLDQFMGFIELVKGNGAVYSNRPPESYVSIWVAKEALFRALSPGFSVCLLCFSDHSSCRDLKAIIPTGLPTSMGRPRTLSCTKLAARGC